MNKKGEHRFTGSLAEEYELITLAYPEFESFQQTMVRRIAEATHEMDGPVKILEIGTGNGFTTRMLIDLCERGNPGTITTIDNDPEMVRQAREHISTPLCTILEADALAFLQDQTDDSWDVVTSAFTIHNLERDYRDEVERHIYRVLRSGGMFANADKYAPDGQERFEALAFQVERFFDAFVPTGRTELLRKWVVHNIDDQSPRYVMFASEATPRLRQLGFRHVTLEARAHMQAVLCARKS